MKKTTFFLIFALLSLLSFGQTTVTIGTGTLSASGTNGSPIYRSSAASTFNFSQSVELLTPTDLSAVGITSGSTITKIAYKKLNAFTLSAGRTASMKIYMKNSSTTAFGTTTNFATYTSGSTLCYDNAAFSNVDLPAVAGWVEFNFTTPFIYTGGSIEVAIDWAINSGTGNATDGAFAWEYTTVTANQAVGTSNSAVITGNLATANTRLYNTQLTYTNSPCSGVPAPGNTVASTSGCYGSSVTLSLQNPTIGSGVTYQWYMNAVAITGATNPIYVIPALTSSDTYYCEVICAGNTTASNSLLVAPSIINAPLLEPFATFLPTCWLNMFGGDLATGPTASTGSGWQADGFANSGTTGAIRNEIWTTGANDWVISPVINIPATGYELKFDAAATQFASANLPTNAWEPDDYIEVLIAIGGSTTNWTVLYTYNDTNQPTNGAGSVNIIDLSLYAGQNVRFAFHAVEGTTNGLADIDFSIDNFQIRQTPSCIEPLNLVSSGITSTGVNISWDATSPVPTTGYEYVVSTSNTTPAGAGTATTSTFASVTSLTPQTTYYVFVRSDCSAGDFSTWTGPISFTTACAPITTLPWNEGFEGLTTVGATFFPTCWLKENGDWTSQNTNSTYSTSNGGTNYIRNSWSATNEYMWTPGFDLVAGTSYDFSSFVQGDNGTGWVVDYFVNSVQNSVGATQLGATYNVPGTGTPYAFQPYALVTRTFVPATSGTYYFAVRVNQPNSAPWYVSFDDFKLELSPTTAPNCATNLIATPNTCGNFSNSLNWDITPSANGYYVTIGTAPGGTDIANAVNVGANSYSFTGTVSTTYYWKVVPYNAAGSASGCTEQSFTTAASGCHCTSVPISNDGLGITSATVVSSTNAIADVTYTDLTGTPVITTPGVNTNVQLTFSTGFTYDINIWIDFNNDFDFDDAGELVKTGIACTNVSPNTVDASFMMPLTAPTGLHRMRIGTADTGQATPNPCYNGSYGVTIDYTVDTTLGSDSFDKSSFIAYPNPVKDILNLSYNSLITNVKVINLLGQEVLNTKTNANDVQVNMTSLNAGAYIVAISVDDTVHTIKVIKE